MNDEQIESWLVATLEDRRLSRSERQVLGEIVAGSKSKGDLEVIRRRAFEVARAALANPADLPVLEWLEDVVKALKEGASPTAARASASAYFSPGDECARAIIGLLDRSKKRADVCVFTITDDRLANAMIDAHRRGVTVRVVTDDAKAEDLGSDAGRLEGAGLPVRVDRSPYHMHHKFAVFDESTLLTGSYNWTRGAAADNEENLIVTDEPRLVGPFLETFERLWSRLA